MLRSYENNLLMGYNTSDNYVIAAENNIAVFINDAAAEIIGINMLGEPICDIIGEEVSSLARQVQDRGNIYLAECDFFGRRCELNLYGGDSFLYVYTPLRDCDQETPVQFSPLSLLGLTAELRRLLAPIIFTDANSDPAVLKSGYQMIRLANNLADYIRFSTETPLLFRADTDIVSLCRDVVESVRPIISLKGIPIRFESQLPSCILSADSQLIMRILLNLISNSSKYTREGNQILVRMNFTPTQCFIVVSDRGAGIRDENIADIFRSYETYDFPRLVGGYGLGLALVRRIATMHGGSAALETKYGSGTNVTISLPIKKTRGPTFQTILLGSSFDLALLELSDILTAEEFMIARKLRKEEPVS